MQVVYRRKVRKPRYTRLKGIKFRELGQEVKGIVETLAPGREKIIKIKAILFSLFYVGAYILLLAGGNNPYIFFTAYFLLVFFLLLNFLNLIHDAVHNGIFKILKILNNLYVSFFDLLGANSYIWKVRHIRLHHA